MRNASAENLTSLGDIYAYELTLAYLTTSLESTFAQQSLPRFA